MMIEPLLSASASANSAADPAERLERLVPQVGAGVLVADVGDDRHDLHRVRRQLLLQLEEPRLGAAGDDQVGAHLGRLDGQRPAQPGADAGDDDDLALQQGHRLVALLDRGVVGLGVAKLGHQLIILRATERCRAAIRAAYSSVVMGV
jgi:hypothetical protein